MPVLAMLLASMLFASSNIGNKIAVADLAVAEVVSGRFLFAAAVLWAMVLLTRQPVVWKEARRPLLMGLLDPGLVSLLIVSGLQYTSAVNVAVFWALMPLFTPIAARLVLGEKINNLVILGALVAVTGAIILGETIQLWEVAAIAIVMVGVAIPSLVSGDLLARFRS